MWTPALGRFGYRMELIIITNKKFYSQLDEESFEYCLKSISNNFQFFGSKVKVQIDKRTLSKEKLRNIFGLKERYGITIEHLDKLITEKTKDYILNPNMYWYKYFNK